MNIYLDIDGTLIHEDLSEMLGKPAAGLEEFIIALRPHTTYWLTTHCREGNPDRAREIMKRVLPDTLHPDIDRILPTVWDLNKTEVIDWSKDFMWFDNDIGDYERASFDDAPDTQSFIEIDLRASPKQLIEILSEL